MMLKNRSALSLLVALLALTTLACSFSLELPWNVGAPDVAISQEQVSEAATRAAVAAATAAALADQAAQIAATAVVGSDGALATASAALPGVPQSLQEKLANIQPDANGNYVVPVTDADLALFFNSQGGSFASGDVAIENLRINTVPDAVVLTGDVTSPLAVTLRARFQPVVEDGRLRFRALDASAGMLPVPASMLSLVEAGVNTGLGQAIAALPAGIQVQDVQMGDGVFTIFAR